ncbi:MAG: hypothetical protein JNL21_26155 [Myxococcales bacterium]|nr:hypothetical protein [Myxococcales bacterium]
MSPDERREVLEQLLERVRRNAANRPQSAAPPPLDEETVMASNGAAMAPAFDEAVAPHVVEEVAPPIVDEVAPPTPAAPRPLVRFEFEEEQTSTGDADQIEALVLAEVAAAEAAARGEEEEPLDGPSTIPPAGPAEGGRLELDDLDSLGAPAPSPSEAPRPITLPPLPPPPIYPPPAYEPPPPAFVAAQPYAEPTSFEAEPPAFVTAPPRYLSEPPPPTGQEPDGELLDDDAVIELDEADLSSLPPEPMQAAFDAAIGADEDDRGPRTDHAGFVDRSSLAEIEERASVAPEAVAPQPSEPASAPVEIPPPAPVATDVLPESQRQKREVDRPLDDVLEGVDEPPPESGEVESQRYPASAAPIVDEVSVERIAEPDVDEAPTPPPLSRGAPADLLSFGAPQIVERPPPPAVDVAAFSGAGPREITTFGELLDRALSLGE